MGLGPEALERRLRDVYLMVIRCPFFVSGEIRERIEPSLSRDKSGTVIRLDRHVRDLHHHFLGPVSGIASECSD